MHPKSGFHISPCRSVVALHRPSTDRRPRIWERPHDGIVSRQLRHLFADLDCAVCFTLTCIFPILKSNWRFLRFRVFLGILLTRNLGRRRQRCRKGALDGIFFFYCRNAPSCGSAAAFDSILVQGTVERNCACGPLLYAPYTHTHTHPHEHTNTSLLLVICAQSVWLHFLTDHNVESLQ